MRVWFTHSDHWSWTQSQPLVSSATTNQTSPPSAENVLEKSSQRANERWFIHGHLAAWESHKLTGGQSGKKDVSSELNQRHFWISKNLQSWHSVVEKHRHLTGGWLHYGIKSCKSRSHRLAAQRSQCSTLDVAACWNLTFSRPNVRGFQTTKPSSLRHMRMLQFSAVPGRQQRSALYVEKTSSNPNDGLFIMD